MKYSDDMHRHLDLYGYINKQYSVSISAWKLHNASLHDTDSNNQMEHIHKSLIMTR